MVYLLLLILWCLYSVFDKFIIRILHHSHSLLDSRHMIYFDFSAVAASVMPPLLLAAVKTHWLKKSNIRISWESQIVYTTYTTLLLWSSKQTLLRMREYFLAVKTSAIIGPRQEKKYCFNLLFHLNLHYMNILKKLLQS